MTTNGVQSYCDIMTAHNQLIQVSIGVVPPIVPQWFNSSPQVFIGVVPLGFGPSSLGVVPHMNFHQL